MAKAYGKVWGTKGSGEARITHISTVVFNALGGTRDVCALREQTRRRPILPGSPRPAAPPCDARPDPPVECPGFGFDKFAFREQKLNMYCRIQNPSIARAGRVGRCTAGRRGWAGQDGTPTDRSAKETTVPRTFQGIEGNCPERLFGSTNKKYM